MRSDQMPTKRLTCELCRSIIYLRGGMGYCIVTYANGINECLSEIEAMKDSIIDCNSTACGMYTEKES